MADRFRVVVLGATQSTLRILQGLVRNEANVVCVFSLDRSVSANVSGFATPQIESFCNMKNIPFFTFTNANSPETRKMLSRYNPDLLFAVGFSQLIDEEVFRMPTHGTIGFHPTHLPHGRGRAPLAWLTYDCKDGAASFFVMGNGTDNGPILAQAPFVVDSDDHASEVENKIMDAIDTALDTWIPSLNRGEWCPIPQDEEKASYTGIRRPQDGLIDWAAPFATTYAVIRAASKPHPGAYTFIDDRKVIIWRARPAREMVFRGVAGRVLYICQERGVLVQAGEGLLWLCELEDALCKEKLVTVKVGQRLGYLPQEEIYKLKNEIDALKHSVSSLLNKSK